MVSLDIPKLIKKLREATGLTQEQLAQKVGVTFCTVNAWQNGRHKPHAVFVKILEGLAEEVGVEMRTARKKKQPSGRTRE